MKSLPVDATTGLESGYGRGALLNTSTADYFSWTGKAGDVVQVASETPGNPGNSGLEYQIENTSGGQLTYFNANSSGEGQLSGYTLPYTGTYLIEVSPNYSYTGEYRFRVTESPPTLPFVTTYDDSVSSSPNTPTLVNTTPGNLTATLAGYIGQGDGNGDYFSLGNVLAGTQINLVLTQPASSTLGGVLNVYNSAGTNLTNNLVAGNTLSYTVPAGAGGTYYRGSAQRARPRCRSGWTGTAPTTRCRLASLASTSTSTAAISASTTTATTSTASAAPAWPTAGLVTATFVDGNDTKGQLWIDGVQQTLTQRQGTSGGASLLYTLVAIGSDNGSYDFTGELDEVAFFTGTLTAAQVQAEYAARTSASSYSSVVLSQNPVAYYRLGEAAGGTVAYDSSGKFDNASFGTGVTPGVAGNPPGDTAYQFTAGTVSAVVPKSTGLFGQYVLSIDVANTTPPQITADTLPVQGTTSSAIIDRFTLNFSEDLNPTTVNNLANYLLQDSQGNIYHLTSPGYTSGTVGHAT